jgi:hypothetical protein
MIMNPVDDYRERLQAQGMDLCWHCGRIIALDRERNCWVHNHSREACCQAMTYATPLSEGEA